jgi:predicted TIM-barrel fold metal-dependent hydrolase
VHTHTPQYRGQVPPERTVVNTIWRPDRPVQATYNWEIYLEAQRPADRSIVFGIAWHPGDRAGNVVGMNDVGDLDGNLNDVTASFVLAHPERLVGFMSIHPHDPQAMEELERCRTDLGLRGIKLGASYQNFDPLESRALMIYEQAQRHGLPILFHLGTSPLRLAPIHLAHPLLMDQIAMRYPDLNVIMAHMGHPWQVDCAVVIRKHPNVYADISGLFYRTFSFYEALRKAHEWGVLHKLLLGSDFPITTVQETIEALRGVNHILEGTRLPRIPEDEIEALIHRESLELLGLA